MTDYDADTVDFGAKPEADVETELDGHGLKGPGYMEAPAVAAGGDAEDVEGAVRPQIPGISEG